MAQYQSYEGKFGALGHWVTWHCDDGSWIQLNDHLQFPASETLQIEPSFCLIYNLERL